ncbi:MAG: alanine--glyoxylate aminotransferase family protein, partial [Deltaproteobacteria bacterium]|nr:alanine--glyoxylate aminotransferase family protein [Deltaproteobacteria bacterium]
VEVLGRTRENLKFLFQTNQPAYLLTASGTGAMEAAVVNLFNSGDEVLVINGGKFGERWEKLANAYSLKAHIIKVEWGHAVDPAEVTKLLKTHPKTRGVLFQASETSTGVYHPVQDIAKVVRENSDALLVVDAITALGVCDIPMDKWGLDAVVGGSQKALMLPPGLAFIALSQRAHECRKQATLPRFYYDLATEEKSAKNGETAWTTAVSLVCGLDLVLTQMKAVGLETVFQHYAKLAEATRKGIVAMGLELFAKQSPSPAVTAVHVPASIPDGKKIVSYMRDRFGTTIVGGQDAWKGKMFRLGHLGFYDELDMLTVLSALEMTLKRLGHPCELGRGVGASANHFFESEK